MPRISYAVGFVGTLLSLTFAQGADWKTVEPLLAKYCYDCHGDGVKKGGLALDTFTTEAQVLKERKEWETVKFNVENFVMPPEKKPQPTAAERELITQYLDGLLFYCDCDKPDPGRVTIRRLNRVEYNNTMRDLVGVDLKPADDFPADDSGYGFDNIGDVLALPPILMERYLMAADRILEEAIIVGPPQPSKRDYDPPVMQGGKRKGKRLRFLEKEGTISVRHFFGHDGSYRIRARGYRGRNDDSVKVGITFDGKEVGTIDVQAGSGSPKEYEITTNVEKGSRQVGFALPKGSKQSLYLQEITIEGPFQPKIEALPASHLKIFGAKKSSGWTKADASKIVRRFANRAFRRPVTTAEVKRLTTFVDVAMGRGDSFEMGVKQALRATLVSPHFLFRIEWQPEPNNPSRIVEVTEYALAARLSYFLWSTMPDDRLLSLAFNKKLRANLKSEVDRMLRDPKARQLAQNFGGQWLETRNLQIHEPNPERYPNYNAALGQAMAKETEEFFQHILSKNESVLDFLNADYTFLNANLAKHYGISGVTGSRFQKVSLRGTPRRGVLTHGSVLTVSSDPGRTSPVKRGKWILDNILGTPPPPPPPNVPELEENEKAALTGSLRERMEKHRSDSSCANCHRLIDPMGFGFENFDAIGAWRDKDGEFPVDASGQLISGQPFEGSGQLTEILTTEKRDQFVKCLIEKMLTYSLGRGVEFYDKCAVKEIDEKLRADDYGFQTLIMAIVESTPFQKRRGDGFVAPGKKP